MYAVLVLLLALTACNGHDDDPPVSGGDDSTESDTAPDDSGATSDCPDPPQYGRAFDHAFTGVADACDLAALDAWVESKRVQNGPWDQDVRRATTTDLKHFTAIDDVTTVATAGVPEVVVGDDGRYYLFHVDGDLDRILELAESGDTWMQTHGVPGLGALALAVSDDGVTFTDEAEFSVDGIVPGMVVDPDVVRAPDGTWRLYYVGMRMQDYLEVYNWEEGEQHDVWMATSTDLVHWTQGEEPAVHGPYADPSIHCFDDTNCVMWSFGLDTSVSTDGGLTFDYQGPWGLPGFAPEWYPLPDGSMRLFYNTKELGAALRSMRTTNGIDFTDEPETGMDAYGEAVTIAPSTDGWNLYYHTFKDPDDIPVVP